MISEFPRFCLSAAFRLRLMIKKGYYDIGCLPSEHFDDGLEELDVVAWRMCLL